jgi:hypothetical protein
VRQGVGGEFTHNQLDVVGQVLQLVLDEALTDEASGSRCADGMSR